MDDDFDLLADYAATGSHAAFDALVKRHADFIYSAARRRVGSADLADDVTQATFIVLARKAKQIGRRESLSAWLYRVAKYAAIDALRRRSTRQKHERQAARPEADMAVTSLAKEIAPHLDAALDRLSPRDREAVLLRFFREQTLEQIGQTQHVAASTVQRRLDSALQRLGLELKRRGVAPAALGSGTALAGSTLAGAIALTTTTAPQTATAGVLALATASSALSTSTAGPIGLAKGTMHAMNLMKLKLAAAAVAGAITIGAGGVAITSALAQTRRPPAVQSGSAIQSAQPASPNSPTAANAGDGVDFARQFSTDWTTATLAVTHVNPQTANPNRGQQNSQILTLGYSVTIKDPANVIGFDRWNSLVLTTLTADDGRSLLALATTDVTPEPWYAPLQYEQMFDQDRRTWNSKLVPQPFSFTLKVDDRLPRRIALAEGTMRVLTLQRTEHIDVPLEVTGKTIPIVGDQSVRITSVNFTPDMVQYQLATAAQTKAPFNGQVNARQALPERLVMDRYAIDAEGRVVGERQNAFGNFQNWLDGPAIRILPGDAKPVAIRYIIAVGLREQRLPVKLEAIDLPVLDLAQKILPRAAAPATSPVTVLDRMRQALTRQIENRRAQSADFAWDASKEAKIEADFQAFVNAHEAGVTVPYRPQSVLGVLPDATGYESYLGSYLIQANNSTRGVDDPKPAPQPPKTPATIRRDDAGRLWVDVKGMSQSLPIAPRDGALQVLKPDSPIIFDGGDRKGPPELAAMWIIHSKDRTAAYVEGVPSQPGMELERQAEAK